MLTLLAACRPVQGSPHVLPDANVAVAVERAGDVALVDADGDTVTVAIMSPGGIGAANVTWPETIQPGAMHLKLYLGGLEELRLRSGTTEVIASVASRPPYAVTAATGDGTLLAPDDPLWPVIEIMADDGEEALIPLHGGYFHVAIPPALIAGEAQNLQIHWIDFYR